MTREFAGDTYHVFLDDMKRQFTVATSLNVENNPDIVDLSQVTSCKLHIEQNRTEEQYRDSDGNMQDYDPPRYRYSYDYSIKLGINSPWFDDMDFRLNNFSVKDENRMKMMDMENLGNQIVAALIGTSYNQPNNMQGGMYGGMYGQPNGMQGVMYAQPSPTIRCDKCGWVPDDPTCVPRFCPECGDPIDGNDIG